MVIPIQITMKAMTIVIIWVAVALRPWKRTCGDIRIIVPLALCLDIPLW
jgi:hypothetical protein